MNGRRITSCRRMQSCGSIWVHMLSGHIRLNVFGRTFDLRPASLLALDQGVPPPHDVEDLEECGCLPTIEWPGRNAP